MKQEWIPVSERMPEDFEECAVTFVNNAPERYYIHIKGVPQTACAVRFNKNWYWWSDVTADRLRKYGENGPETPIPEGLEVTAWMPMPDPYKEE